MCDMGVVRCGRSQIMALSFQLMGLVFILSNKVKVRDQEGW